MTGYFKDLSRPFIVEERHTTPNISYYINYPLCYQKKPPRDMTITPLLYYASSQKRLRLRFRKDSDAPIVYTDYGGLRAYIVYRVRFPSCKLEPFV